MNMRVGILERMREPQRRGIHPWQAVRGFGVPLWALLLLD